MHSRRLGHSCGRPQVTARTADNAINASCSAPEYGWYSQRCAATTPVKGVEVNASGAVMPITLMSRFQRDITGNPQSGPSHQTGPYVNSWESGGRGPAASR